MRENSTWSISLGRWGGLDVRLHVSFLVCAVLTVFVCSRAGVAQVAEVSILALGILFASVLLHELAHLLAAIRLGGRVDRIVLSPLGGLHPPLLPPEPHREILVAMAGPLVNFLIVLMTAPALALANVDLKDFLLSPLDPHNLLAGDHAWLIALRLTCWINCLLLLNLFPAYPLDAGHALTAVLRPIFGARPAVLIVASSAMLLSVGLVLMAFFLPPDSRLVPTWLELCLFAIFLFFHARAAIENLRVPEPEDDLLGYDFSEGYTSLDRTFDEHARRQPTIFGQWLAKKRELRRQRLAQLEQDEERQVDQVLVRLKDVGMDAISPQERSLLNRVSKRYRNRQRSS